jgi:hypothetical protein
MVGRIKLRDPLGLCQVLLPYTHSIDKSAVNSHHLVIRIILLVLGRFCFLRDIPLSPLLAIVDGFGRPGGTRAICYARSIHEHA